MSHTIQAYFTEEESFGPFTEIMLASGKGSYEGKGEGGGRLSTRSFNGNYLMFSDKTANNLNVDYFLLHK